MNPARNYLSEYNDIIKKSDELYRNAAKAVGLSDCAFWILYFLRESGRDLTQSEICAAIYVPKQTINSALKIMEKDGYIRLLTGKDRRSKLIHLTEKGITRAAETVDRVISIECEALNGLTEEEQTVFIGLFRKYTELLKERMTRLKLNANLNLERTSVGLEFGSAPDRGQTQA